MKISDEKINNIISKIPKELNLDEKVELLYLLVVYCGYSETSDYKSLDKIEMSESNSKIFKDLCDRLGIKCEICKCKMPIVDDSKQEEKDYMWNTIEDEIGRGSNVDVTYGMLELFKQGNVEKFCMISNADLIKMGPYKIDENSRDCDYTVVSHRIIQNKILSMFKNQPENELGYIYSTIIAKIREYGIKNGKRVENGAR